MKFTQSLIVAALLGNISAVSLNHRHHYKHHAKHHRHQPKNIGVRFVQSMAEDVNAGSVADPSIVEEAAPETNATELQKEVLAKKAENAKEQVAAIEKTIKKAVEEVPEVKEPTEDELANAKPVETPEEYKELKKEVKAKVAAQNAEPADLPEDEAKAAEEKNTQQLVDKAEAQAAEKKLNLASQELANLNKNEALNKKIVDGTIDAEEPVSMEQIAEAKAAIKKDEKLKVKVMKTLAEESEKVVEGKKKEQARTEEAAAAEAAENAEKQDLAQKQAKLAAFEEAKKESDLKVSAEFAAALPEFTPKNAKMPEDDKLQKAQKKIDDLNAEEEKKEEERKKEIEASKEEVGPNPADAAVAKAEADFDQQKELERQKAQEQVAAEVGKIKAVAKESTQEKVITQKGPMNGEEWTANMPTYVREAVPYKVPNKSPKQIKVKAINNVPTMNAFGGV